MKPIKSNDSNPFRSKRLLYRAIDSPYDDEIFHHLHKNQETYRNADHSLAVPPSRKRTSQLRQYYQQAMLGVFICLVDGARETPIGALSLKTGSPSEAQHRKAELAISVAPEYQNYGYGTEAIQWTLDWAFTKANLHRVYLEVLSYNDGAIRLYKRIGFRVESIEKESIWHDNAWHGALGMAMLDYEWEAIRDANL